MTKYGSELAKISQLAAPSHPCNTKATQDNSSQPGLDAHIEQITPLHRWDKWDECQGKLSQSGDTLDKITYVGQMWGKSGQPGL